MIENFFPTYVNMVGCVIQPRVGDLEDLDTAVIQAIHPANHGAKNVLVKPRKQLKKWAFRVIRVAQLLNHFGYQTVKGLHSTSVLLLQLVSQTFPTHSDVVLHEN